MGSLRDFKALEEVVTDTLLLLGPPGQAQPSLAHMLPRTIKSVVLHDDGDLGVLYYRKLMDHLSIVRDEEVPQLNSVRVVSVGGSMPHQTDTNLRDKFVRDYSTVGINIKMSWSPKRLKEDDEEKAEEASGWSRSFA